MTIWKTQNPRLLYSHVNDGKTNTVSSDALYNSFEIYIIGHTEIKYIPKIKKAYKDIPLNEPTA